MYIWRTYVSSKLWILLSKEWKLKGNLQSVGNQVDPADIFSSSDIWLLGLDINISSVVEFQRWWVLKSKILAQESTCSKEILIPTTLNYLWSSVVFKVDCLVLTLFLAPNLRLVAQIVWKKTPIYIFSAFDQK